eukprot:4842158-Pyramimonas_sp.AAC.1
MTGSALRLEESRDGRRSWPGGKFNWGGPGWEGLGIPPLFEPGGFPRMAISPETSSQNGDVGGYRLRLF